MKYPAIIFFRYKKYLYIDSFFNENKDKSLFTLHVTDDKNFLNNLFDPNYQLLITFGDTDSEYYNDVYSIIATRMEKRWMHFKDIEDINHFNNSVNYCFIHNVMLNNVITRVTFSIFTTCYNSYEKIMRAYNSLKDQIFKDWEWIILDDSPDDEHFKFLKTNLEKDKRIRLYKRSSNSGNIGNVKNEAVSLSRGKYLLELDHDDEILPSTLLDAVNIFEKYTEIGFIYTDFINIYENGNNFNYGNFYGLGYGGYYNQKYKNKWVYVSSTPNINNITLSHIVGVPNHPRIWRKDSLIEIGNYSEFLPIADDYQLLLRTASHLKIAKIHKFSYIQYMNNNNNNFSLIRNGEINRLCPYHIKPQAYDMYNINEKMKELDAYEDEKFIRNHSKIWERPEFTHKYCNKIVNVDYDKIYCIISLDIFKENIDFIRELYKDSRNDFLLLDNKCECSDLWKFLDDNQFDKMKCYAMKDSTIPELINYFHLIYKSLDNHEIIAP